MILIIAGLLTLVCGGIFLLKGDEYDKTRFWIVLLQNSVYFLLMTLTSVFIQAASTLAQGSWITAYRRVPEAIGANLWVFGLIAIIIMFAILFGYQDAAGHNPIYSWYHHDPKDEILNGKSAFLNPSMFVGFTLITVALWAFFGHKFRALSIAQESAPKNSAKIHWTAVRWGGGFLVVYALTQMSTTPWLWMMSIQPHWFSTMFSWYTFASAFVSGMSLILLWVVYLKNQGNLVLVTKEHMHDLGKFMFAFSIFWTYLWFDQYMLIWYGNIPEETVFFKLRQHGPYAIFFYANIVINFVMPILILMSRPSKRNYFTATFMAMVIIFGHWIDFYQIIIPQPMGAHWSMGWYELGILALFAGIMIACVSRTLTKTSLIPKNNIFLKEAVVHLS